MVYKEFKKSSRKHLDACKCIEKMIIKNTCPTTEAHLLSTLYYLSGYIVETILKYGIFYNIAYDEKADIKKVDQDGITYERHIRKHNLTILAESFNAKSADIVEVTPEVKKLFDRWSEQIRYQSKVTEAKNDIQTFLTFSEKIYKKIARY